MAHKEVEDAVEKLLEPILEADGIEVVDVEYVRKETGFFVFSLIRKAASI